MQPMKAFVCNPRPVLSLRAPLQWRPESAPMSGLDISDGIRVLQWLRAKVPPECQEVIIRRLSGSCGSLQTHLNHTRRIASQSLRRL